MRPATPSTRRSGVSSRSAAATSTRVRARRWARSACPIAARPARRGALSGGEAARLALAGGPALTVRRPPPRRADQRPRRSTGSSGSSEYARDVRGRARRRVARPRLPRRDRDEDRRDRSALTDACGSWAGGWWRTSASRDRERAGRRTPASRQAQERRRELTALLSQRQHGGAQPGGAGLGDRTGGADRRGTHALMTKVRQTERLLERNPLPEKPFEPWELQLTLRAGARPGDVVVRIQGAEVERGTFRLGPIDLDVAAGDRLALVGPNGSGKSTLLAAVLGEIPLVRGTRVVGRATVIGEIGQEREAYTGRRPPRGVLRRRPDSSRSTARTLLAKFGLGDEHVGRASRHALARRADARAPRRAPAARASTSSSSTSRRTTSTSRPSSSSRPRWTGYDGALVVVSHDRRFLERIAPTRTVDVRGRGR